MRVDECVNNCRRARGQAHPKAKLTDQEAILMRYLHRVCHYGYKRLAKRFGCHRNTARQICNNSRRRVLSPEELMGTQE